MTGSIMDVLALVVMFAPLPLMLTGWWFYAHPGPAALPLTESEETTGWIGLLAASVSVVMPWGVFLWNFVSMEYLRTGPLDIERDTLVVTAMAFGAASVFAGALGPQRLRIWTVCAGALSTAFWFIVSGGIL